MTARVNVPPTLLPTAVEFASERHPQDAPHPFLRTVRLPPLDKLPRIATQLRVYSAGPDSWEEQHYECREALYEDVVASLRLDRADGELTKKVERTKWIARRTGSYSFGLPVVALWHHVITNEGGDWRRSLPPSIGHYVPADAVRDFLWTKYGFNLALLSACEEAVEPARPTSHNDTSGRLITEKSTIAALSFFGVLPFPNQNKFMWVPYYAPSIGRWFLRELERAPSFTTDFVALNDLAILVGHIELRLFDFLNGRGKLLPKHPALSCGIRFSSATTPETASVTYFAEGPGIEPKAPAPLPGGLRGKPLDAFLKLQRLRGENGELATKLAVLRERYYVLHTSEDVSLEHPQAFAQELGSVQQETSKLKAERAEKSKEARSVYIELLKIVARRKESILGQHKKVSTLRATWLAADGEWAEKRDRFVSIPSPLEGLPAHMALLPAGLELLLQSATDPFGRAILKVARPTYKPEPRFPLNLYLPEEREFHAPFMDRMAMIFGKRQWLLAQGITAFAQLYRARGGYEERGRSVRITIPEWCRAMRPDESSKKRIAEKGTNGLFGSDVKTADAFHAFFDAAQAIHFPDPRDEKHTVAGLITITGYGTEAGRGDYVHVAMNPDLYDLMVGEGQRPMFMVTNAAAMLSYREQELSYLPAAQFALELLARQNLYNRGTATLSSPTGDGFARLTMMSKFGLVQGPRERPAILRERFDRLCKGLLDKGVVASIQRDGRERDDWRATKLHITMSEDYRQAYNLNQMRQRLAREEKLLEAPFAPPKRARIAA